MKLTKSLSVTVLAIACFVAASAASTARDVKSVLLNFNVTVSGAQLASGKYNVKWQTHSPEVTVSFMRGNKVVATVAGKLVDRGTKFTADSILYDETANGGRTIREIRFKGSSEVIEFN